MKMRRAKKPDEISVLDILRAHDIYYSALVFKDFWVAEEDNKVIGCAQLEEFPEFLYLGSLGVDPSRTGRGVASALIKSMLKGAKKDIYLYTVMPGFFEKLGFEKAAPRPDLPSRDRYECEDCHADRCVCMARRGGDS